MSDRWRFACPAVRSRCRRSHVGTRFFERSHRTRPEGGIFRAFFSPLSTLVTHKILGSQFLQKRILDARKRVAFYWSCAPVESVAGEVLGPVFFQILCEVPAFRPGCEAGGSGGFSRADWGSKSGVSVWNKYVVNTIFSVCRQHVTPDNVNLPRRGESQSGVRQGTAGSREMPANGPEIRGRPAFPRETARGEPAVFEGGPDAVDICAFRGDCGFLWKGAIYRD